MFDGSILKVNDYKGGGIIKDFFISYTGTDEKYALWVAKLLEDNAYSVVIQAWDFGVGDNFVSRINDSLI